jgi:hypothetical protein
MPISQTTTLSKPSDDNRVPVETYAYFRARAKRFAYELAIREFKKSNITKATLARRLGKGADRVSKMLAGPGNWTIDTLADLLFATAGGFPTFGVTYPLDKPPRNFRQPDWLDGSITSSTSNGTFINFARPDQPAPTLVVTK